MKTRPRIKVIISSYDDLANPFYGGGGAVAIHEVTSRLTDEFDITLITGNYPGAKSGRRDNIDYQHIGPSFFGPKISQLLFHFLLPWYAMHESYDIWLESFTPPFSTSCLQLFTRRPVVGLAHMLSGKEMLRKYKLPFDLIERHGLKTYRYFVALTEASRAKISRLNPSASITLVPNGTNLKPAIAKPQTDRRSILFVGRLEIGQKGLDLLLEAYAGIAGQTDADLIIAGTGLERDQAKLQQIIQDLGLSGRVQIVGHISGPDKEQFFRDCTILTMPSRHETFGIVALEALSYGKPVVTFDLPDLHWMPAGAVAMARPFDAADYGRRMQAILADPAAHQRMARAAVKAAQAYSWDMIAAQYRRLLRGLTK